MTKNTVETFNLIVNEYDKETKIRKMHDVKIVHDFWTWKPFKKQAPNNIDFLKGLILKDIKEGKKDGIYNYNNFECGVDWELIKTTTEQIGVYNGK